MKIGIDAVNIRHGGGITHLKELLDHASPEKDKFSKIIVWSNKDTLNNIGDHLWLKKKEVDKTNFFSRTIWQSTKLTKEVIREQCDVLFVPGGSFISSFRPVVTMNQNLLPFMLREVLRYGFSLNTLRLLLLRIIHERSYKRSDGCIFLTTHAQKTILGKINNPLLSSTVINHGIDERFFFKNRKNKEMSSFNSENKFKIVNISSIEPYKMQSLLIEAIQKLYQEDYPVMLEIYGGGYSKSINKLKKTINKIDSENNFSIYKGQFEYSKIEQKYREADLMLYSSTCETFGQTVTEAMASSLAIVSSKNQPMPEILGNSATFYDLSDLSDLINSIRKVIDSSELRDKLSLSAYNRASNFSWNKCSSDTFKFLHKVYEKNKSNDEK